MLTIQFEYGQQDRFSETFGPFEFVQATYDAIRVGKEGERVIAHLRPDGLWETEDSRFWSDFIIAPAAPDAPSSPSIDWRTIAVNLGAALESCTTQIHQMKGMFPNDEGIAKALIDAEEADDALMDACKAEIDAAKAAGMAHDVPGMVYDENDIERRA